MYSKDVYSQKMIGILMVILPILSLAVTFFTGYSLEKSLVEIHFYPSYIIFEGISIALGIALILYKGYDLIDRILSIMAGISIISIVLFPFSSERLITGTLFGLTSNATNLVQGISQSVFAIISSVLIIFQFTKGDSKSKEKKLRNLLYYICGGSCLFLVLVLIIVSLINIVLPFNLFLIFQSFILVLLGFSWILKSGLVLFDKRRKNKK